MLQVIVDNRSQRLLERQKVVDEEDAEFEKKLAQETCNDCCSLM